MPKLAIVIPAYKSIFFDQALLSIANQTNKEFTLYIGDDCSPDNLYDIVKKYEDRIHITYRHFDDNLGGKDLVAQWERCIDLVGDEEWVWLFSDDDIMDSACVENFYLALDQYPEFDLFHFNVLKIDESENIIGNFYSFPEILTSEEFLIKKLYVGYFSTVVEYIFRKSHFYNKNRFQNFDLAWCSDDATWIKLGKNKGIRNIENSKVSWRISSYNICSLVHNKEIVRRKLNAQLAFASWLYLESKHGEIKIEDCSLKKHIRAWFMRIAKSRIKYVAFGEIAPLMQRLNLALEENTFQMRRILLLYYFKIYKSTAGILKRSFVSD